MSRMVEWYFIGSALSTNATILSKMSLTEVPDFGDLRIRSLFDKLQVKDQETLSRGCLKIKPKITSLTTAMFIIP